MDVAPIRASPFFVSSSIRFSMKRAALSATRPGSCGDRSAAIISAFRSVGQSASVVRNSRANVVLPAPFGPARIKICLPMPRAILAECAASTGPILDRNPITVLPKRGLFTLRCTQRLLTRLKHARTDATAPGPTTLLGDWYANLVHVGRSQLVLAVSPRTFLPVVLPAAPATTITTRLRDHVGQVLRALEIDARSIDAELAEMTTVAIGPTASRQVTGILVEFANLLELHVEQEASCLGCAIKLAKTPCGPLYKTHVFPDRATAALFAGAPQEP